MWVYLSRDGVAHNQYRGLVAAFKRQAATRLTRQSIDVDREVNFRIDDCHFCELRELAVAGGLKLFALADEPDEHLNKSIE